MARKRVADYRELLRAGRWFRGLPQTLQDALVTMSVLKSVRAGTVLFSRGHGVPTLHCRPASEWIATLRRLGFSVEAMPMSAGTPFANVLLVAHR